MLGDVGALGLVIKDRGSELARTFGVAEVFNNDLWAG